MKTGIDLITEERLRQMLKEGWTPEHDDAHGPGTLATAGASYALLTAGEISFEDESWKKLYTDSAAQIWPFDADWFKPADSVRNLVKAGALIAAEIDRIQRQEK